MCAVPCVVPLLGHIMTTTYRTHLALCIEGDGVPSHHINISRQIRFSLRLHHNYFYCLHVVWIYAQNTWQHLCTDWEPVAQLEWSVTLKTTFMYATQHNSTCYCFFSEKMLAAYLQWHEAMWHALQYTRWYYSGTPQYNQDMIFLARGCPDQRGSTIVFVVRSDGIVYNSIGTYIDCSILKVKSWSLTIVLQTICTH